MEKTPKLPRKSLSLTSRLRNRSSASPGSNIRNSLIPSSPITPECGTPPNRKYIFNTPYSPTNDFSFSPRSTLSQSSTNSPEVTWRWTQDDPTNGNSSPSSVLAKSTPNSDGAKEFRKKRSVEQREALRKVEIEKRKANRTKRNNVLKQKYEQMELLITKKNNTTPAKDAGGDKSPAVSKERSPSNSSGYGSNSNIDNVVDLLNDSESDGLLLEATQKVETTIEKTSNSNKNLEQSFAESSEKENNSICEYLQDSLDDWFASLDDEVLADNAKKPRTSFQRYKSMPTAPPSAAADSDTAKIKRYPSSSTLPPKSKFRSLEPPFRLN